MALSHQVPSVSMRVRAMESRETRLMTVLLIGRIIRREGEGDGLCRVRNISSGGLMAEVCAAFSVGEKISVELRNGRVLDGEVRWAKSGKIGVHFDQPVTDIAQILSEHRVSRMRRDGPARRSPRLRTDCTADIQIDGRHSRGAIANLSQHGARLVTTTPMTRDQMLRLAVAGLPPLRGTIRWLAEDGAGITFLEPIGFSALAQWFENPALRYNRHREG